MNKRLAQMKEQVLQGSHHQYRQNLWLSVDEEAKRDNLSWMRTIARLTRRACEAEKPVIGLDERIVFTRTVQYIFYPAAPPEIATRIAEGNAVWTGAINNICPDWGMVIGQGLIQRKTAAMTARDTYSSDPDAVEFLDASIETIDAIVSLITRYAQEAERIGKHDIAAICRRVPAHPATTFHEALQSLRFTHAMLWLSGHTLLPLGRFDQYMWPYLERDLDSGRLTPDAAQELLEEFFISLNRDADLYGGVQRGDNGQSLVLGGVTADGISAINPLTTMALRAARSVAMIDPKINLRVTRDTDAGLLALAAELTRMGLGFPQYLNDDIIVPALVKHGYALTDARNYAVAACWEPIIPGKGMEIVNIGAVSFPAAVDSAIRTVLAKQGSFDEIITQTESHITRQVKALCEVFNGVILPPAPYFSALMDGCLERGADVSKGLAYNNFGIHGAGSSNAADALAAVKKYVYEEKIIQPHQLIAALDDNYEHDRFMHQLLLGNENKVGLNDDFTDRYLSMLFDRFASACESIADNGRGGIVRPGSGSAWYYVALARGFEGLHEPVVEATADGRRKGDFFASSLAPSLQARMRGPISVLQSFGKIDYQRIVNGGPVTMELSDTVFKTDDDLSKVAQLIRSFIHCGCQQLQLNTINVDTLREAQEHPERHRNLIVRVWGWSGYFCELDRAYQDQIIQRHGYALS